MRTIHENDLIQSIHDALQYIACYHPPDYLRALTRAWEIESSPAAKDAIEQILYNSRLCAQGRRPICQDTGMVVAFVDIGVEARIESRRGLDELIDIGVARAYTNPDNPLRASMVSDPLGARRNTGDNTPAIVHTRLVPGDRLRVRIAAKGGGSENKARFTVLNPNASLADWVVDIVPTLGAGWCPPGMLGIGVGGDAEKALLLAKESLMAPIDMATLLQRGPSNRAEELRIEIYRRVNDLGIGAQGLGGLTTVLDVKLLDFPTHAASLPVGLIPNCAATRHIEFELDGSGPARLQAPRPEDWPEITWRPGDEAIPVDLEHLDREQIQDWKPGDRLLLSGRLLTARDAAHKRIVERLERGEPLPDGVDLHNRMIYYVGPVDPVGDEVVGPAGPTTATRMDGYTETLLAQTGLIGMIGKAERGSEAIEAIRRHRAVYLIAVGGAALLVAQAIRAARIVAFEDLGMEAIREFTVENMPVTVAVDSRGDSIHASGPAQWRGRFGDIPIVSMPG